MEKINLKYSVLMSVYYKENAAYLKEAIDSMLKQTIFPDEIIIIEDGPLTDELNLTINYYKEKYNNLFTIFQFKKNMGLGVALNKGVEIAKNELIARMDTDDISIPERCEKELDIFNRIDNVTMVGSNITEFIEQKDNIISKRIVPENDLEIKEYMKKRCPFNHMSVMFKKSKILEAGNYIDLHYNEDYYLWIRLYEKNAKFYNIQENLVNVRVGKEMYKRRGGMSYFKSEKKIQDYMLKNNIISFITYMSNIIKRFILQVLMPNKIRGFIFKKFARKKI